MRLLLWFAPGLPPTGQPWPVINSLDASSYDLIELPRSIFTRDASFQSEGLIPPILRSFPLGGPFLALRGVLLFTVFNVQLATAVLIFML
jgi:hypothetical protein